MEELRDPQALVYNQWSTSIYGEDTLDTDFIESIRNFGVKVPIVAKSDGTVISGNRRLRAAQQLGLEQVPVHYENYETEVDEREAIIEYNRYREKTFSQKMQEAEFIQETERIKAEQRQKANLKQGDKLPQQKIGFNENNKTSVQDMCPEPKEKQSRDETAQNSVPAMWQERSEVNPQPTAMWQEADSGESKNKTAPKTGLGSGRTYYRAKKIWDAAKQGDEKAQEIVNKIDKGEASISEGEQEIKKRDKQKEVEQRKQEYSQRIEEAKTNNNIGKVDIFNTDKRFRIIYADPPWEYAFEQTSPQLGGVIKHYNSMSIEALCTLPIPQIAQKDSVLFLWITSPKLNYFLKIMDAWGFEYKTSFIWDKVNHNMGHYNSIRHEFLLVGGKGKSTPDVQKLYDSIQSKEKSEKHSKKPDVFINIIDELYVDGDRIELFARKPNKDTWHYWGDEV